MKHIFLSLATLTTLLLSTTANGDDSKIVYDVMGDPLISDQKYYIVPYKYAPEGGGFTWEKKLGFCPQYNLIQHKDNTDFGEPTSFYPISLYPKQTEIRFSTNINIAFKGKPPRNPSYCHATSNVWKVDGTVVQLGGHWGEIRDPSSKFTIEDLEEGGYSIRFCPSPSSTNYACGGLGIDTRNGERHLVVNGTNPLAVAFEPELIYLKKYGYA